MASNMIKLALSQNTAFDIQIALNLKSKGSNGGKFEIGSKIACFNWTMDYFFALHRN